MDCRSLKIVVIPDSVRIIEPNTYSGSLSLKNEAAPIAIMAAGTFWGLCYNGTKAWQRPGTDLECF